MNDKSRGLYNKFDVQRLDGSAKHQDCEYFVLDLDHDPHAIAAIFAYADSCHKEYPALSKDLYEKARKLNERVGLIKGK